MGVGADVCACSQDWAMWASPGVLVIVCLGDCIVRVCCIGLGFLSSLPLLLVCHTHVFSCTYGLWVGIYAGCACAQRSVSPI